MPGKRQSGFTLVEMLMAHVLVALLALNAHTLIRLGYSQFKHLTQPAMQRDGGLFLMFQWIENDLLQSHKDLPWHMDGSLDVDSCVVSWAFVTENFPVFDKADAGALSGGKPKDRPLSACGLWI